MSERDIEDQIEAYHDWEQEQVDLDEREEALLQLLIEVSSDIIDLVETRLREIHPELEEIVKRLDVTDEDASNTLLRGIDYYDLEYEVIDELRRLV